MHAPGTPRRGDVPQVAAAVLDRLRAQAPRVHCITNAVAQNFTANMLLAAGCVPAMTISPEEVAAFVSRSQALLVNLGTFDRERREAITVAVEAASQHGVPWVLDPVLIDRAPPRAAFAAELVAAAPNIIRLNRAEFTALSGAEPLSAAVADFAGKSKCVVALSGETDLVADGERLVMLGNGHPLMAKVTAMGCAGSAIAAACLAVESDPWHAALAALLILGIAGELAATAAKGPGSFAVAMIDAVHNLDGATLMQRAKVT